MNFVDIVNNSVQSLISLGPSVIMPVIMFVLALVFGLKVTKSIRSGLLVGAGFVGLNLVVGLLGTSLGTAAQAMVKRIGTDLSIYDAGWPVASTIAWMIPASALMIPLVLLVNAALLALRLTHTMNIDIWNYWHFAYFAMIARTLTGNLVIGLTVGVIISVVYLLIADWLGPQFEDYYKLPGVTCTTGSVTIFAPIAFLLDKLWDRIPGINRIVISPETIQKRIGFFGDPLFIGVVIGGLIGLLAGYDFSKIATLAITMGAVMLILPKMVAILMEGLNPIAQSGKKLMSRWFGKGEKVYIGMDAALALGNTANLATASLTIPIVILLAFVLPGNKVLPFVDLASMAYFTVCTVLFNRGNVFRGVLNAIVLWVIGLYLATWIAPDVSSTAAGAGYQFPKGVDTVVSLGTGAHIFEVIFVKAVQLSPWFILPVAVILIALLVLRRHIEVRAAAVSDAPVSAV